jgi:cobyrinic acid a,c-diamide synthase
MPRLPRIAVGTVQAETDGNLAVWAMMAAFQRAGLRVQSFASRACFAPHDAAQAITGFSPRHLDSWLMPVELCRELFVRGSTARDLALVEGTFARQAATTIGAGDLETLCRWLDLPSLAIVDVRSLSADRLPERPERLDGLLLDRVTDEADLSRWVTLFESIWHVPVLGWLGMADDLRGAVRSLRPGQQPDPSLCHALGERFAQGTQMDRIVRVANSRPFPRPPCASAPPTTTTELHVAVAYDEAFQGYFSDTLDLLESHGATVSDFSPLRDERLPPDTDVVYIGCGHPEWFAAELAQNDCLMLSIKSHLCGGRRMYAEGGGLAYLCQQIEFPSGDRWPMVGALPATAHLDPAAGPPRPGEITLQHDTWLGPAGERWRGYLNTRWSLSPPGALDACTGDGQPLSVVRRHQAIGSRMYLNFAAHGQLLDRFFAPCARHAALT